jgi:Uma2 family endonuclease
MSTAKRLHYSYAEYLRALEDGQLKLEYCDGVIYAMAGGTPAHAELAAAVIALIRPQLLGECSVYTSDLKIRVEASDLSTFPDVSVVCGPREVSPIDANAITNPAVVVEVTSRSTEDYDRGDKVSHYKQLPSLGAILLVSHRSRRVTAITRAQSGWEEREVRGGERLGLAQPALELDVDALYAGIDLDPE